ncbi:MAG: S41 family peptidase [Gammaproteobacteria bacterium]
MLNFTSLQNIKNLAKNIAINITTASLLLIPLSQTAHAVSNQKLPLDEIQRFTSVVEYIKNYYIDDVKDSVIFENAIRGMLSGLDPHSSFFNAEEFKDLQVSTTGKFGGLGVEVLVEDGFIRIISPLDDTPAHKAGVQAGDLIIKLDDTPVKGLSPNEAITMMRGDKDTEIALTIIREGLTKPLVIKVKRDIISATSVKSNLLEPEFAYLRISHFQSGTGDDIKKHLDKLIVANNNKKLKGLILDLRNNPGGVLDASVEVADAFLDKKKLKQHKGLIVYTKGRMEQSKIEQFATPGDLLNNAPIVLLINEGSASASEIVAGALQDHKRAVIVGTKSFGKGSVQTVFPLKDNLGLKLTTALYYTPSGISIQAEGINPDIQIKALKIPKTNEEPKVSDVFTIKEQDLKKHLENGNNKTKNTPENNKEKLSNKSKSKNLSPNNSESELLIFKDYQLHEALNILKSLSLVSS